MAGIFCSDHARRAIPAHPSRDLDTGVLYGRRGDFAGFLNMSLPIAISFLLMGRNWLTRILAGLAACLIGGAFYLTQSRGGQVALGAALLVIVLTGIPRIRVWMRIVIVVLFALVAGMVSGFVPLYLFNQVNHFLGLTGISLTDPSTTDYSTAERLAHWIAG